MSRATEGAAGPASGRRARPGPPMLLPRRPSRLQLVLVRGLVPKREGMREDALLRLGRQLVVVDQREEVGNGEIKVGKKAVSVHSTNTDQ